ncbi:MAG: hypothetical protein Q4B79_00265, partial [Moraxella sp.]|uniref:hypothetical protein n=1 Tax=Moraxella sp. TaxID=479 RepID=UPI0026DAAABA
MSTILLAIGVIVIFGIVAFFVFQKLQAQKTGLPTTPQVNPLQAPTPMPTPVSTNELAKAEAYVQNQNYNEAITELKRILMTNPHHHGAMLKLLQVYGITKQFSAFNQLHQKIHEIADSETIREADFCKSLLAEEIAKTQTNNQTPNPAAPTQTDAGLEPNLNATPESSLEFDLETLDVPEPAAKTSVPAEPMLDLNDLNFNPSTPSAAPASAPSLDFDDLSFDEPKDNTLIAATEPAPSLDLGSDLDFNLEPQAPVSTPATETKSDGLDFGDLDLGLGSEPAPVAKPTITPVVETKSNDGLDFGDLDLGLSTPAPTPVAEPAPSLDLGSDLDFNLEPQAPVSTPATETKSDGLDFGDLDLGLGSEPKPIVQEPAPSLDLGSDLDFNLEPQAPVSTPATETKSDGLDFGDLDLGLGSEP